MIFSWISENSAILNSVLQALLVIIWTTYLQLFLLSYLRQRRPVVLINRSVGSSEHSRCFIANMGAEPLHLTAIVADVTIGDEVVRSYVTDREELTQQKLESPSDATNQGPLKPADFVDAGSYGDIVNRALHHAGRIDEVEKVSKLELIALCSSGYSSNVVGGSRAFEVGMIDGSRNFVPLAPTTKQLASRRHRRANHKMLHDQLSDERNRLENWNGGSG